MITAVFIFAILSAAFEAVLITKLSLRTRLRVLGSSRLTIAIHLSFIVLNMVIHFGTLTGSMTAIVAGLTSFAVMPFLKRVFGYISGTYYVPGLVRYTTAQLR